MFKDIILYDAQLWHNCILILKWEKGKILCIEDGLKRHWPGFPCQKVHMKFLGALVWGVFFSDEAYAFRSIRCKPHHMYFFWVSRPRFRFRRSLVYGEKKKQIQFLTSNLMSSKQIVCLGSFSCCCSSFISSSAFQPSNTSSSLYFASSSVFFYCFYYTFCTIFFLYSVVFFFFL